MPLYEVTHSYPLTLAQKTTLATSITHLHTRLFTVPSLFVNVHFVSCDATESNYFVAGKVKTDNTNRIVGLVRTSDGRKDEHWKLLAQDLEKAWNETVGLEVAGDSNAGDDDKKEKKKKDDGGPDQKLDTEKEKKAKKLLLIAFHPMLAAREKGLVVPKAGEEANWVKENMHEFQRRADLGEEEFVDLITEIDEREDLKSWRS